MATFTIVNLSSDPIPMGDFYFRDLAVGETLVLTDRSASEVSSLRVVQEELAAGNISFSVAYTAAELASGLMSPPNSIGGDDFQEVAAATPMAPVSTFYKAFVAGGGGPDDVVIFAANNLPFKFRVLDAHVKVSAPIGGATLLLRDEAAGAGNLLASMSGAAAGRDEMSDNTTAVATPGATKGLFLRRSDNGVAGEVIVTVRRES